MNVCYILKSYPRLSQTFILHELLELQRQGVQLTIIARKGDAQELRQAPYQALEATVHYLPEAYRHQPEAWIAPLARQLHVDHLHAHFATWAASTAMKVSQLTGIPYSFTAHAHDIFHHEVDGPALAEKIAHARFTITVTEYNRAYLEALMRSEQRTGQIIRLYNGIDLQHLRPAASPRTPHLIVGVGRLIPKKGFDYLIEACRLVKAHGVALRCILVGDGEERAALEAQAAQANLQETITFVGAQPHAAVIQYMRDATLFALPCVISADGDRDALPTVLLEAMALGTPVISTHVSGIPEIIHHGISGLLVPERSADALALALEALLCSAALRDAYRVAGLARVQQDFDLQKNVSQLKHLFSHSE